MLARRRLDSELLPQPLRIRKSSTSSTDEPLPMTQRTGTPFRSELVIKKKRSTLALARQSTNKENIQLPNSRIPERRSSLKLQKQTPDTPPEIPRQRQISRHRYLNRLASGMSPIPEQKPGQDTSASTTSESTITLGSVIESFPTPPQNYPYQQSPAAESNASLATVRDGRKSCPPQMWNTEHQHRTPRRAERWYDPIKTPNFIAQEILFVVKGWCERGRMRAGWQEFVAEEVRDAIQKEGFFVGDMYIEATAPSQTEHQAERVSQPRRLRL